MTTPYSRIGIVQGYAGSGPNHWQTWLAQQCQDAGMETHYPDLPDFRNPKLEAWIKALDNEMPIIDEKTVLVGHSLGCAAILHWLKRPTIKSVGLVILVGPASPRNVAQSKQAFLAPFYQNVDLALVRKKSLKTELFASDNDIWMSVADSKQMAHDLGATLHLFHNAGHLSINAGFHTFPQVLERIMQ